jgi:rare lipoprotein A
MRSSMWTKVIVSALMMGLVCVDLSYGGSKNNSRDFKLISGTASVYDRSSGKQTASGERLDEHALTAAHRSLPFGTVVKVKNNRNGREALVRINDRGPFMRGRLIDLTPAGAKVLGFSGTADVSLTVANTSSN